MKRLLAVSAIFIHFIAYSQSEEHIQTIDVSPEKKADIQIFFSQYLDDTRNMEWDKLLDKTHPGLYKLASKEQLKAQLEEAFTNDIFTTSFDEIRFKDIPKAFSFENVKYYLIDYYSAFSFVFMKEESQSEEDFDNYLNLMQSLFKSQLKDSEVVKTDNTISIKGDKQIVVIDDANMDGYKMLEVKKEMINLYSVFLPKPVITELFQ